MQKSVYTRKEIIDFLIRNGYTSCLSKNKEVDRIFEMFVKPDVPAIKIVRTLEMIQHSSLKSIIGTKLFNEWCKT